MSNTIPATRLGAMKTFLIRQTVDVEVQWLWETEDDKMTAEEALRRAYGNFDDTSIVSIQALDWDMPFDSEEIPEEEIPVKISNDSKTLWQSVGVI